jgi:hypothetical protein
MEAENVHGESLSVRRRRFISSFALTPHETPSLFLLAFIFQPSNFNGVTKFRQWEIGKFRQWAGINEGAKTSPKG